MRLSPLHIVAFKRLFVAALLLLVPTTGPTQAADCNINGIEDLADTTGDPATSEDCNDNGVPDECETAPLPFELLQQVVAAVVAETILAADFDGDGTQDLLIGAATAGSLLKTVEIGETLVHERVDLSFPTRVQKWAVSDVDQDGDPDAVGTHAGGLMILANDEGDLSRQIFLELPRGSEALAFADLTGDGFPEAIVTNRVLDQVLVAENVTGANAGSIAFSAPKDFAVGMFPAAVVVDDFDSDGKLDVVTANRDSHDLSLLRGTDGDSLFAAAETFAAGGERPEQLVSGDFDADGRSDVAVGSRSFFSIHFSDSDGFTPNPISTGTGPQTLAVGDADGDAQLDVIGGFVDPQRIIAFLSRPQRSFDFSTVNLGDPPIAAKLTDVDGDGDTDFIASFEGSSTLSILRSEPPQSKTAVFFDTPEFHGANGRPHSIDIGDVDSDGDLDIVTCNNRPGSIGISVIRNQGDGTYARPEQYTPNVRAFSVVVDDLDGDGHLDIATSGSEEDEIAMLFNRGNGAFGLSVIHAVAVRPFHVTTGDLDGDGRADVVTANRGSNTVTVLFNTGEKSFDRRDDLAVGSRPSAAAVVDLDGDGHAELVTANTGSGDLSVLRNLGGGSFADPERILLSSDPVFVFASDMDADGSPDLVTANQASQSISVIWNRGGSNGLLEPIQLEAQTVPYSVLAVDLSGDGHEEIVVVSEVRDELSILASDGARGFFLPILHDVGLGPRFAVSGDIDSDGTIDLVSGNRQDDTITVIRNRTSLPTLGADRLERICTPSDFFDVSRSVTSRGVTVRATKYVAPARADDASLLSTQYQNVNRFELHEEFLGAVFPERFPSLPGDREFYNQLIGRRATRDYYVGVLTRRQAESGPLYTFTAVTDTGFSVGEILEQEELEGLYTTLKESFTLEPLAYEPDTELARRKAETFQNPQFPVHFDDGAAGLDYEPYTLATGYGRVRLLTLEEFNDANDSGTFTFQDVLVVDLAPRDIEGIVGGVITAEPQGNLSHVAVRTARRGTPNAFVKDARDVFAPLEGKLVRLQVFDTEFFVDEVELEEAQEFWDSNRPRFEPPPTFDELYSALDSLAEIDLDSDPVSRFGGKASNFARLQRLLTGTYQQYQERGFAIPMHHYLRFMNENTLTLEGGRTLTFQEHLDEILAAPEFQSDSQLRFEALDEFRDRVRGEGVVDPALIAALAVRIEEVFGDTTTMVRFRSSSNVEDRLVFNGAGLYESTSVCAQDTLDPASPDASHCDPTRTNERTIERALKKVWSSLWTFRAHEERTFFQIPPQLASMGILCSRAFLDESANGVAFTGNPTSVDDKRYVITAQLGEQSVVSPEPGVSIERSLLEVADGEVVRIIRDRSSTLVPPGEVILTDEQLIELGGVMAHADAAFELDLEGHQRREVLLDFEFKIEPDGSLAIKQVRPFLIPNTAPKTPTFELEVPEGSMVCSVFSKERVGREPRREFETKSTVRLVPGVITLPTASDTLSGELFAEVRFGAAQELAVPLEDGLFRLEKVSAGGSLTTYRFSFEQTFALGESDVLALRVFGIDFKGRGEVPIEPAVTLNDEYLTFDLTMEAELNGEPIASYSSCTYSLLPQFELAFELDGGDSINIRERFLEAESLTSTGPAAVVHAAVELGGERRVVTDYWKLVYTAQRHNLEVRYWILFEPAISAAGLAKPVHAVEVAPADREIVVPPGAPPIVRRTESSVTFLDADFEPIATPAVIDFSRRTVDSTEPRFRRGDVNSDGIIDLADALAELSYLFRSGETPVCLKAADADDDGRLNVSDAITILLHLFRGAGPLPQPGVACGVDSSSDALACESQSGCR